MTKLLLYPGICIGTAISTPAQTGGNIDVRVVIPSKVGVSPLTVGLYQLVHSKIY